MGHDGLDPQSYPLKLKAYVLWLKVVDTQWKKITYFTFKYKFACMELLGKV